MANNSVNLLTATLKTVLVVICATTAIALMADVTHAASFTVNSTDDVNDSTPGDGFCDDGSGQCTLRAAIEEANALAGIDVITLTADTYTLLLGELSITSDIVIQGNGAIVDAGLNSRVFSIVGPNTVTLSNLTIQGGQAAMGAGLYHDGGNLTLNFVTVTLNLADDIGGGGGGIYNEAGTVILMNTDVVRNDAYYHGGGIHNKGRLIWNSGHLSGNRATLQNGTAGGGLFNAEGALADLHNLSIMSNTSFQSGGGIFTAGQLTVTESIFESNHSGSNPGYADMVVGGGGLAVHGDINTIAVLRNVIIRNNTSSFGGGGGICVAHTAYLEASNVEIYNNDAGTDGGGIGVNCQFFGGTLLAAYKPFLHGHVKHATLSRYRFGLSAAWPLSANVVLTHVQIYRNTAGGMGGGIHNDGARMVIHESDIRDNQTAWFLLSSYGGGLSVISGTVGLDAVRVEGNVAALHGGGIYNTAGLHIRNGTAISGNVSGSRLYADGGGLYNNGNVALSDAVIVSNTAWGDGGGIYSTGNITFHGSVHLERNRALIYSSPSPMFGGHGGGMYIQSNGNLTLGPAIHVIGNRAELDGGGIYAADTYLSIVNNLHIQRNVSGRNGGGVFARGPIVISQSQLLSNTAAGSGGAIYVTSTNGLIYKSTFSANRANGIGGGIAAISASVRLSNTTISGNSAARGGGLGVDQNGRATLNNVTLAYNNADNAGASIYAEGSTRIANTIVAQSGPASVTNCAGGGITSGGYNLETGTDCGLTAVGDQQNTDPLLEPLALNAPGNTWTHALSGWPASPAIDTANNATCEPDDQRSVARPIGPACDIGAYETDIPDLVVSKSDGGAVIQPGDMVTYTILYTNVGRGIAVGVVLSDVLPAYMTFVGPLGPSGWFTAGGGVYTYSLGNLPPGASGAVQLIARPVQPWYWGNLIVTNTVHISGGPSEDDLTNNTATDTTPIQASFDLQVSKRDHGRPTHAGGLITYTIVYTNHGNMVAAGVVLTEMIPAHTTYSGSGWTQVGASTTYTQWVGDVLPGQVGTTTLVVQVNDPLPAGVTLVSNTVLIGDSSIFGTDTNPTNNRFTINSRVGAVDPAVHISDGGISVTAGSLLTYTITFTNVGSFTATNVILTFSLPTHTQSAGNPLWTLIATGIYSYTIGTLAPGQAGTVIFVVQVDSSLPSAVQSITATVSISDDGLHGTDINLANNTASEATPIFRPTAVTLIYFVAISHPSGGALVRWQTAMERNTWGFHVLRSTTGALEDAERVTSSLIPGGNPHGATYEWHDTSALPGRRYSYWLQEIELDGTALIYGPVYFSTISQAYLPIVRR